MTTKREVWVDYIKAIACFLVLSGHLFQSLVRADIILENTYYQWFDRTIYYFHVQLFFICSGYLYQRYGKVSDGISWIRNIVNKTIVLGIPYFVFSFFTWLMKTVFSSSVNSEAGSLFDILFLHPTQQFWYLYVLLFLFVVTPRVCNRRGMLILITISFLLKFIGIFWEDAPIWNIFVLNGIFNSEIWFALGMLLSVIGADTIQKRILGGILGIGFLVINVPVYTYYNGWLQFGMGLIACASIFMLMVNCREQKRMTQISRYTMPIYLMHTIFAAGTRACLLKAGINSAAVHVSIGLMISIAGSVIAMNFLEKVKLDWIVYPARLMKKSMK